MAKAKRKVAKRKVAKRKPRGTDKHVPKRIADLHGDAGNPRKITTAAAAGLSKSLTEFGDLSGIVFNTRTNELVSGHQRVGELRKIDPELEINFIAGDSDGFIALADGTHFAVRLVDWPRKKQNAANLAANNRAIQGSDVADLLELRLVEVKTDSADLYGELLFDKLESKKTAASAETEVAAELLGKPQQHQLSAVLTEEQHAAVEKAVELAKRRDRVSTLAEAIAVICSEFEG